MDDSILVLIDFTEFDARYKEDLIMTSIHRLRGGGLRTKIEKKLEDLLKRHPGLRRLREKRRNEEIARKIRMIRDHGQAKKYFHDVEGYNGRLDAIQAGVLRIKLKRLDDWNRSRRENAAYYNELLSGINGVILPVEADFAKSVYHLYVILVDNRDDLQQYLNDKGIGSGLHYPLPLHMQKAYDHLGYKKGSFPVTESVAERLLSLPMFPELTREQIEYVAESIKEFMNR